MADFNLFDVPDYYGGLLGEESVQKLKRQALGTGLINAAIGFIAQPRNQRYGSALPYLGKALAAGYESGQDVIKGGLRDYETKQKIEEMKRKQEQQQAQQQFLQQYAGRLPENQRAAVMAYPELGAKLAELDIIPGKEDFVTLSEGQIAVSPKTGKTLEGKAKEKEQWTEPYSLGGQTVQRNVNTGQIRQAITLPPQTNVNVNTKAENKYLEKVSELMAPNTVATITAGQSAPEQIESARRIKSVLEGKTFTGAGAEQLLAINNALAAGGVIDPTTGINTEMLMADMAKTTLQNIKSSGLGAGQGFSNADRDFLEKASAGKITLNAGTIKYIAELNERAGMKAIDKYNSTIKGLPEENRRYLNLQPIGTEQYRPKGRLR